MISNLKQNGFHSAKLRNYIFISIWTRRFFYYFLSGLQEVTIPRAVQSNLNYDCISCKRNSFLFTHDDVQRQIYALDKKQLHSLLFSTHAQHYNNISLESRSKNMTTSCDVPPVLVYCRWILRFHHINLWNIFTTCYSFYQQHQHAVRKRSSRYRSFMQIFFLLLEF